MPRTGITSIYLRNIRIHRRRKTYHIRIFASMIVSRRPLVNIAVITCIIIFVTLCTIVKRQSEEIHETIRIMLKKPKQRPLLKTSHFECLDYVYENKGTSSMICQRTNPRAATGCGKDGIPYQWLPKFATDWQSEKLRTFKDLSAAALKACGDHCEGSIGRSRVQADMYERVVKSPFIGRVCETGFNVGYSSMVLLLSNPNISLTNYDFGLYITPEIKTFFENTFPGGLTMVKGDTRKTLPSHVKNKQTCELLIIDGGHRYEEALADYQLMRWMANKTHNLVIMDDLYCLSMFCKGPRQVWQEAIDRGELKELYGCAGRYKGRWFRGFAVGQFIF